MCILSPLCGGGGGAGGGAGRFPSAGRGAEYSLGGAWTISVLFTRPATFPACPRFLVRVCSTCMASGGGVAAGGGGGAFRGVVCAAGNDPAAGGGGRGAGGTGETASGGGCLLPAAPAALPGAVVSSLGLMCALFARRKPPLFPGR
jgi:hypothetical protein